MEYRNYIIEGDDLTAEQISKCKKFVDMLCLESHFIEGELCDLVVRVIKADEFLKRPELIALDTFTDYTVALNEEKDCIDVCIVTEFFFGWNSFFVENDFDLNDYRDISENASDSIDTIMHINEYTIDFLIWSEHTKTPMANIQEIWAILDDEYYARHNPNWSLGKVMLPFAQKHKYYKNLSKLEQENFDRLCLDDFDTAMALLDSNKWLLVYAE